jgi:hypothetical protein
MKRQRKNEKQGKKEKEKRKIKKMKGKIKGKNMLANQNDKSQVFFLQVLGTLPATLNHSFPPTAYISPLPNLHFFHKSWNIFFTHPVSYSIAHIFPPLIHIFTFTIIFINLTTKQEVFSKLWVSATLDHIFSPLINIFSPTAYGTFFFVH